MNRKAQIKLDALSTSKHFSRWDGEVLTPVNARFELPDTLSEMNGWPSTLEKTCNNNTSTSLIPRDLLADFTGLSSQKHLVIITNIQDVTGKNTNINLDEAEKMPLHHDVPVLYTDIYNKVIYQCRTKKRLNKVPSTKCKNSKAKERW
jgi:hypothetical protein